MVPPDGRQPQRAWDPMARTHERADARAGQTEMVCGDFVAESWTLYRVPSQCRAVASTRCRMWLIDLYGASSCALKRRTVFKMPYFTIVVAASIEPL